MKKPALLLLLLAAAPALRAQEPPRIVDYDLTVRIDVPHRQVAVDGSLGVDFRGADSIALVLRGRTRIDSLHCDGRAAAYRFDTLAHAPVRFIPDGRSLVIYRPEGASGRCRIAARYTLDLHEVQGPAQAFDEDWIEMGYYAGWYPVCPAGEADRSHLRIGITDGWTVDGSGIVSRADDGTWEVDQPWPCFDNVILASPTLKSRRTGARGMSIEIIHTDYPEAEAAAAQACGFEALEYFRRLYGVTAEENTPVKFALSTIAPSGGYSRKNFIMIYSERFDENAMRVIAHEIAHFWWNRARVDSWQDWLNESFAEFSALQYLRHALGEQAYADRIETYRLQTRATRPIRGIGRDDREAFAALYKKGSVLLADLLVRVGEKRFYALLSEVIRTRIADTDTLLDLAEKRLGRDHRRWIEQRLKA